MKAAATTIESTAAVVADSMMEAAIATIALESMAVMASTELAAPTTTTIAQHNCRQRRELDVDCLD